MCDHVQDEIRTNPLYGDLSLFTWYGWSRRFGLLPRAVRVICTNDNDYSLIEDSRTKRKFIRHDPTGEAIPFLNHAAKYFVVRE